MDFAEKQSEADRLDGIRKRQFSVLVNHYTAEGNSTAASQHLARADDAYEKVMTEHHEANREANLARAMYDSKKISMDYWRTRQATKRAQMKML